MMTRSWGSNAGNGKFHIVGGIACAMILPFLIVTAVWVGVRLSAKQVFLRRFDEYELIVKRITPELQPGVSWVRFEKYESDDLGRRVMARKESDGTLVVMFIVGGTFPVHHFGFVYSSNDDEDATLKNIKSNGKRIRPHWFQWSD
jgi:hypothetical protein